jgi:hypothetical protein
LAAPRAANPYTRITSSEALEALRNQRGTPEELSG